MLGAALFGLTAGVVILGMHYLLPSLQSAIAPAALQLDVRAQAEGIHVRWDPQSRAVSRARDARLIVLDGDRPEKVLPLNKEQLRIGHVYYEPAGERTEFRLEVSDEAGHTLKDSVIVVSSRQPPAAQLPTPAGASPATSSSQPYAGR